MNKIIQAGSKEAMTNKQFLEREINKFKTSTKRKLMFTGENYYLGEHDILDRKRTVIGEGGALQEVTNLPNNKQIDNQYAKMVDQKVNYLLGKPITLGTDNKQYEAALQKIFNKKFHRMLKNIGENALNCGICWLHPYYNDVGELCLKRFDGYEILPFWKDAEHTILEFAIRLYEVQGYDGKREVTIEKVEVYTPTGIDRYILSKDKPYAWDKIPLIPFKYNHKELPLIVRVKSLQDGINVMLSDFQNNMQEDARNTILVIKNYDGENLAEFRHNLATYGAVKVKTVDGADGGIDTLTVEINSENYKTILHIFKNALIENAKGYDAKDDRLMQGNPNQMNIQSMYSDIDLDANGMETEFQASFEELLWFVNVHLANNGEGNFENQEVEIIFNRDILINESESIGNCQTSVGILSTETIVSQHPWVSDVEQELERLKKEKEEIINDLYNEAFNPVGNEDEE